MASTDISDAQVVRAAVDYWRDQRKQSRTPAPFVADMLVESTGQSLAACVRAIDRCADDNLVDYGVSLRTCWPTDKGRALLEAQASETAPS